jgi:hypothetical protein
MILISIHPFASRKLFFLIVAFLFASSAFCFADSLFMTRHYAREQHRTTFGPFRAVDISGSVGVESVAANSGAEDRGGASRFSEYGTDDSTSSRATASRRACVLNSSNLWWQNRAVAVNPAEESFLLTVANQPVFAF